jgi:hypothetical protein
VKADSRAGKILLDLPRAPPPESSGAGSEKETFIGTQSEPA